MSTIAERYLTFARHEAAGRSPRYEQWAQHVAHSPHALAFLDTLPVAKQQPNLFFAALRQAAGTPTSGEAFDARLTQHRDAIRALMLTRSTQTNEPGRCATLLPAIAAIDGKLALIEVGASAGLCLLMDHYGYDWGTHRLLPHPALNDAPCFPCKVNGAVALPHAYPDIVWRAGLDLNPLDVTDQDNTAWLEQLVWPEDEARLARLRASLAIARHHPPRVVQGDLLRDLDALIAQAPPEATVVVYHSAVLSYVADQALRDAFASKMLASRCVWISNESPRVFPQFVPKDATPPQGQFLLSVNGRAQAWTDPHGARLQGY